MIHLKVFEAAALLDFSSFDWVFIHPLGCTWSVIPNIFDLMAALANIT